MPDYFDGPFPGSRGGRTGWGRRTNGTRLAREGAIELGKQIDEFEFFFAKEWSDGFPMVTPTEERIQWMLTGTQRDPDEVVGRVPPALETATVRAVAIHALMAGCKPAYLPVVLGGLALILREELNMGGVQCTMHGVAPMMIVNGPYAQNNRPARRQRLSRSRLSRERGDRPRDPADAAQSGRRHCGPRLGDDIQFAHALHGLPHRKHGAHAVGNARGVARLCAGRQRDHRARWSSARACISTT